MTTDLAASPVAVTRGSRPSGRVLAVASGKGGVGKTWFAVTLAHALSAAPRSPRVLLVDCDLGLANVDVQLGLAPTADLGAVAEGTLPLERAVARHPAGFDVLPGRSGSGALNDMRAQAFTVLLSALDEAAGRYDVVVLDLAAGVEPTMRRLALFADSLLLLITADPTSLTDGYAVLKLHARDRGHLDGVSVVVNQAASATEGVRTHGALARACRSFLGQAPPLAGVVRADGRVREAIRRQTPLLAHAPGAPAANDVRAITAKVTAS